MGDYEIVCKVHDSKKVITHVGIKNSKTYPVLTVVNWIRTKTHSFYVNRGGHRVKVHARQRSDTKRWFLTTDPDGRDANNLDFLPDCK